MNFKDLLENKQLLEILHNVLTKKETKNKVSNISKKGEEYVYNQYSLLIVMDIVIKYQIIINDREYNNYFLEGLKDIAFNFLSHKELILNGNKLLINLVSKKLNIKEDTPESKAEILKYIYEKYIVKGYCFHSFPSIFKKQIEEEGLTKDVDIKELNDLKKISYIFNNHNYVNIISKDLKAKSRAINITDSPAMAYFYAFRSPEYLAELTSLSNYYKYIKDYNHNAFYEKDYHSCKENLSIMCDHLKMSPKEKNTILKTFDKRWNKLDMSNSMPCIAFIKRSDLAKDSLPNIKEIINSVDKIDINILVSKIIDSRYKIIRRYSDINSLDLKVITMPSYREIKANEFIKDKLDDSKKVSSTISQKKSNYNFSHSYGNANLFALLGLLLISLGLTLSIIIKVIGDQL